MSARAITSLTYLPQADRQAALDAVLRRLVGRPAAVEHTGGITQGVVAATPAGLTVDGHRIDGATATLVMDLGNPDDVPWAK